MQPSGNIPGNNVDSKHFTFFIENKAWNLRFRTNLRTRAGLLNQRRAQKYVPWVEKRQRLFVLSLQDDENRDENDQMIENNPPKCLPEHAYVKFNFLADDNDSAFWKNWNSLRLKAFTLVKHKNYEIVILAVILLNSLALVSFIGSWKKTKMVQFY